jgi:PAS domain S-box-containing protein
MPGSRGGKNRRINEVQPVRPGKAKLQPVTTQANQRSKEDWENTFNAISDWVAITDLKGRILRTNTIAEKFTGVALSEIVGQSCCKLVHVSDGPIPGCPLLRMLDSGRRESIEVQVPGSERWLMVTVDPVVDERGNVIAAVHITRDITERKKTEQGIRESEEKYRDLVEKEKDIIYTLDDKGNITSSNPAVKTILGYEPKELIGKNFRVLIPKDWQKKTEADFNNILKKGEITAEAVLLDKKGQPHFVEYSSTAIREGDKIVGTRGIVRDLTERKKAERALRVAEERFSKAFRASPDAMTISRMADGTLFEVNDMWEKTLGYSRAESLGTSSVALGIWSDPAIRQKAVQQLQETGSLRNFETDLRRKTGEVRQVSLSSERLEIGSEQCLLTIIHDITEHKKAEEALRETRDYLENLINYANAPIIVWDPESKIVQFNHAFERLTSYQADEVIGQELSALFPVASRDKSLGKIAGTLGGEYWEVVEIPILCKDGEVRIALWNSANIYAKDGRTLLATIAQGTDITERKRAEQALRQSENKYRTLLENLPQKIFLKDRNSVYISCNENYARDLKITPEQIIGKTDYDFHPKELAEKYRADDKRIISSGQSTEIEEEYIQDGRELTVHTVKTPLRDGQGNITGVLGIFWDITESKKMEDALRDSEQKYRDLFENARDTIITTDVEARITGVNKLVEEYGFKKEQLVGKSIFDFIVEEHKERGLKDFKAAISGNPVRGEMDVITRRGIFTAEYIDNPIKRAGEIIGIQAILRDVTERRRAEQLLRKERDRSQKYLDVAGVMLVAIDSEQRVGLINKKGCEILGYKEEEILGKNWFNNFLPERVQREVQAIFQRLMCQQERTVPERHENPILTKSGDERLMAWHNSVLRDDAGKVIAALGSGEDITEQRKAEQKSLQYQSQLRSVASRLTVAEERERQRIATELHDQIGQSLAISKIKLDALRHSMRRGDPVKVLEDVCNALGQAIAQTRSLTFDLSSPILHQLGFEAAVAAWLTEQIEAKHHISTIFEDDEQAKPLDDDVRTILFRNVRELLINVVKHANAHKVKVSVRKIGSQIQVDVQDDGAIVKCCG